jgi:hypothetical protein
MTEPAQKILVRKYLDWDRVSNRLSRYEYIGKYYDFKALQDCSEKSPYYCHYLAWRLGTWLNENVFIFLNELLKNGSKLPNWKEKIENEPPNKRYGYENFFHFLWELQVANFFSEIKGVSVEWTTSGPDIKISSNGKTFYIDCYTFTKSFAIELFIEELLLQIHPSIRVLHTPRIKFSLPKDNGVNNFLDEIFRPYLDPHFIESKVKETEKEYPVLLPPQGINNLYIYIEGNNPDNYIPDRLPNASGIPEDYLRICLKEAICSKQKQLSNYHPNILAVNYLLSGDFQIAANRQKDLNKLGLSEQISTLNFFNKIDGLFFSACGINDVPSLKNSYLKIKDGVTHPILLIDQQFNLLAAKGDEFLCSMPMATQS